LKASKVDQLRKLREKRESITIAEGDLNSGQKACQEGVSGEQKCFPGKIGDKQAKSSNMEPKEDSACSNMEPASLSDQMVKTKGSNMEPGFQENLKAIGMTKTEFYRVNGVPKSTWAKWKEPPQWARNMAWLLAMSPGLVASLMDDV
jgi:hypothetical protein